MLDVIYWIIPLSILAGFITSVAGGGGILFVTTATAFGLDPLNAMALNRITDIGVICGSLGNYRRVPEVPLKEIVRFIPLTLFGAVIGANFVVELSDTYLQALIVGAAIFAIIITAVQPKPIQSSSNNVIFIGYVIIACVGLWEGMIAMAGATLFILAVHYFFNLDYLKARVVQMYTAIPETLISAGILTMHSTVNLKLGLIAYFSATIGAFLGSKMVVAGGQSYIRVGVMGVSLLMVTKLILIDWLHLF